VTYHSGMRHIVGALGGTQLLIVALAVGVVLLRWKRMERWGHRWLTALAIVYWVMGTLPAPLLFASVLARGYQPLAPGAPLDGVTTVVVLSAGSTVVVGQDQQTGLMTRESLTRVLEGVRALHMLRDGRIVATGPPDESPDADVPIPGALVMRSTLSAMGVPADRLLLEMQGRNTREQAVNVAALLRPYGISRIVLVTSAFHMPRAAGCFRAVGLVPIPAVSASQTSAVPLADYVLPNDGALQLSQWVLHEYVGLVYYRARGWL
jgi:uncharacterized SAM-binding protein YcdF (DUF218 family)